MYSFSGAKQFNHTYVPIMIYLYSIIIDTIWCKDCFQGNPTVCDISKQHR